MGCLCLHFDKVVTFTGQVSKADSDFFVMHVVFDSQPDCLYLE